VRRREFLFGSALALAGARVAAWKAGESRSRWRAGTAVADITPEPGIWMAGYAARTGPAQGTALPLAAKALALEDEAGRRAVLVTLDLLGVTAAMRARIAAELERRAAIAPSALMLATSHTHSGPVVREQLFVAYGLDQAQRERLTASATWREGTVVETAVKALAALEPCELALGEARATFAANRRTAFLPTGPVDHAVPVLHVTGTNGRTRAVVFGYACHNTTLQAAMVRFHGDYAGVAQREIEAAHPGAVAFFVAGCGADANPSPRGTLELVEQHGTALATAVSDVLPRTKPIGAGLATSLEWVPLPFAPAPGEAHWRSRLQDTDVYVRRHAQLMLDRLAAGTFESAHQEPIQVWRLGDWRLVALGGEVVVDYLLRIRRENSGPIWVAGYANDVSCYVPSLRVLREGGYEGGGAMLYYGRPGPFDETVEERIVGAVRRGLERCAGVPASA